MKLVINKNSLLESSIVFLTLADMCILNWLGLGSVIKGMVFLLVYIHILTHIKTYIKMKLVLYGMFWILYCLFSYFYLGGTTYVFVRNIYNILLGIGFFSYFEWIYIYKYKFISMLLKKIFVPLNLIGVLNIPVILLQYAGYALFMGIGVAEWDTAIEDKIAGLCGKSGGVVLMQFFLFLFVYNMLYSSFYLMRHKILFLLYNLLLMAFMIWVSYINSTRAFAIVCVLFLTGFLVSVNYGKMVHKFSGKDFLIFLGIIFVCVFAYLYAPIRENIQSIMKLTFNGRGISGLSTSYRMGLFFNFFIEKKSLFMGYGTGNVSIMKGDFMSQYYYTTELGDMVWCGGVIFWAIYIAFIHEFLKCVLKKHILIYSIFLVYFVQCLYTSMFSYITKGICFILYVYCCSMIANKSVKESNSEAKFKLPEEVYGV